MHNHANSTPSVPPPTPNQPKKKTPHSSLQWFFGLTTFLYPGASQSTRQSAIPWHVWLGMSLYFLALSTTSQGILEKLTFLFSSGTIDRRSGEAILGNFLGLLVYVLGGLVMWTAFTHDKIKDEHGFQVLV